MESVNEIITKKLCGFTNKKIFYEINVLTLC